MTTADAGQQDQDQDPGGREESLASLLNRVLQISVDIYNLEAGAGAITHRQYAVLSALEGFEGLSQNELARRSGIDRSTLAELLARMTHKGLVQRTAMAGDGRAKQVWLDTAGRAILAETAPRVRGADDKVLALMSPPERASFVRLLRTLAGLQADALPVQPVEAVENPGGQKKKRKRPYVLESLPMPSLSEGAVTDLAEGRPAPKWKAPKPIWKVGR